MKTVIVMVQNGVVSLIRKPKDVKLILRDYDIDNEPVEVINDLDVKNDEWGLYVEEVLH
jgi:hypothetical protein